MLLTISEETLHTANAFNTAKEITQQPQTWEKTVQLVQSSKEVIHNYFNQIGELGSFDIVLMGAGTSEYIGNTLVHYLNKLSNYNARSIASTDMILNPEMYINPNRNTLFISYGRSGNSPESVGSVSAVNAVTNNAFHLFITCNKNGSLAKLAVNNPRILAIELPEETNDLGFAMTSSFTNMLLATVLCFNVNRIEEYKTLVSALAKSVNNDMESHAKQVYDMIQDYPFERIVYLGSQCIKGFAQESALKILELTQGRIPTLFDTLTGFRHGPKSFINPKTLIVIYLSDDDFTRRYELDLINELKSQQKGYKILIVNHKESEIKADFNIQCDYNEQPMILVGLKMIVIAHMIPFFKSYSLGITVDNPCPTGEVNRVVTGVTIYPVERV